MTIFFLTVHTWAQSHITPRPTIPTSIWLILFDAFLATPRRSVSRINYFPSTFLVSHLTSPHLPSLLTVWGDGRPPAAHCNARWFGIGLVRRFPCSHEPKDFLPPPSPGRLFQQTTLLSPFLSSSLLHEYLSHLLLREAERATSPTKPQPDWGFPFYRFLIFIIIFIHFLLVFLLILFLIFDQALVGVLSYNFEPPAPVGVLFIWSSCFTEEGWVENLQPGKNATRSFYAKPTLPHP